MKRMEKTNQLMAAAQATDTNDRPVAMRRMWRTPHSCIVQRAVRIASLVSLFVVMILINLAAATAFIQSHNLSEIRNIDTNLVMGGYQVGADTVNATTVRVGSNNYDLTASGTNLLWRSNTVWRSDNDGAGSGLSSDNVDGYDSSVIGSTLDTSGSNIRLISLTGGVRSTITAPYATNANYANSAGSAGNADTVDGWHAASLFDNTDSQQLGTSGNQITLTNSVSITAPYANNANLLDGYDYTAFGASLTTSGNNILLRNPASGQLSSIVAPYATSAGNADTVDGLHASSFVQGSGTLNYLAKFTGSTTTLGQSVIYQNGDLLQIGGPTYIAKLSVRNTGGGGITGEGTTVAIGGYGGTTGVYGSGTNTGVSGSGSTYGVYSSGPLGSSGDIQMTADDIRKTNGGTHFLDYYTGDATEVQIGGQQEVNLDVHGTVNVDKDGTPAYFIKNTEAIYYASSDGAMSWGWGGSFNFFGDKVMVGVRNGAITKMLYVSGDFQATGVCTCGTKPFLIDHPSDPANKIMMHSSVESDEMMTMYKGNSATAAGSVSVQLPDWFVDLNGDEKSDYSFSITPLNGFCGGYYVNNSDIAVSGSFTVHTEKDCEFSWVVYAVRHDPYAVQNRIVVEKTKMAEYNMTDCYIRPEAYGLNQSFACFPDTDGNRTGSGSCSG